ncbi:MAG: triose-phosphate isomerase [Candidatus Omnitrophica bacterium]|nr:triose-phosphate isomerase [Candidatus Omnitrophota bacterium]
MRKIMIAGNWKMYKTIGEASMLAEELKKELATFIEADIVICPTFTALNTVYSIVEDTPIKLGAQNLFWESEGAYTGEISPVMIKACGCEYVIIGHSERRKYFNETNETVNKRIKAALGIGLNPIICVGETLQEREADKTKAIIEEQLTGGLEGLSNEDMANSIIAYEPVWAIGTGKTATPDQAQEIHAFIRGWIKEKFSTLISENLRILYGGSVKPENSKELMGQADIDGALVGGASLKEDSFAQIAKNAV